MNDFKGKIAYIIGGSSGIGLATAKLLFEVENKTKPDETRAISENAGLMQPEDVAKALIKGMHKEQALIIPGLEGKLTGLAKRLAPSLVEWVMDRSIRRAQKS